LLCSHGLLFEGVTVRRTFCRQTRTKLSLLHEVSRFMSQESTII
jgi:hypothetical protein